MRPFRTSFVFTTLLLSTVTVCAFAETPRKATADSASGEHATSSAPSKTIPPDHSLSPQEYARLGLPPVNRQWSSSEFAKAVKALGSVAETEPSHLPRFNSKKSGDVLARLTRPDALSKVNDSALSIQQRIATGIELEKSASPLVKLYFSAFQKGAVGGAELIEATGCLLRVTAALTVVMKEFTATLDKNDKSYRTRMDGLNQMQRGLKEIAEGALITLREREVYRTEDLARLLTYLDETLPTITAHMAPDAQKATLNRIGLLLRSPAMKDFVPSLTSLRAKVKTSVDAATKG